MLRPELLQPNSVILHRGNCGPEKDQQQLSVQGFRLSVQSLSHAQFFATPWTAAHQAPPSMGFPCESTGVGCHCLLQHLLHSDLISADLIGMEYYLSAASICIS